MKYEFNKKRFEEFIEKSEMTQLEIAKKIGTPHTYITYWKQGHIMTIPYLLKVCNALDISPSGFFICHGETLKGPLTRKESDGSLATKKSPAKENDVSDINYINQIKKMEQQIKEKDEIISLQKRLIDGQAELIGIQREFITEQRNDIKDLWDRNLQMRE